MSISTLKDSVPKKDFEKSPKYVFIINPISGRSRKKRIGKIISEVFSPDEVVIRYTKKPGHGYKIARRCVRENVHCCIAVGGDGTVNEVASALVNTQTVLGIIPAGSGNGLANYLKIPANRRQAIQMIVQNSIRTIDVGKLNNRYFFCTCGIGFDARVGHEFALRKKRGLMGYVRSAIRQFIRYQPKKYCLKIDGQKQKVEAFLITIANSGQYGNNVYISPGARIDDGQLDVCIVKPFPKVAVFPLGIKLLGKKIDQSPYHEVIRGKKITLTGKKKKQRIHIDGESLRISGKIKIQIKPGALKVIAPDT
jgi:diacylglycerol kinase (ATP)